jgi:hypothetical protein
MENNNSSSTGSRRSNRCQWKVMGSGTFDEEGRVVAWDSSHPRFREGVKCADENSAVPPPLSDHVVEEVREPYSHDHGGCFTADSTAPTYILESLTNLPSLGNLDSDTEPPPLTSSSTKSSIASEDSSPVSSVCSSLHPTDYDKRRRRCRTSTPDDDDLSCSNSCCSSDESPNSHDSNSSTNFTGTPTDPSSNDSCPRSAPDLYGQKHPIESVILIATKLQEFENEILHAVSMHDGSKTKKGGVVEPAFLVAERTCPNITTPSFKLMFLRCECYHVENAVKRYIQYWEKRVEVFGALRAYQPITVESLYLHNDHRPLECGSMQIIQRAKSYDTSQSTSSIHHIIDTNAPDERNILWFDPSKLEPTQYSRESGCRALWYVFHAYLEDVQVQQRGLICINYSANFSLKNRDPPFTRMCLSSLQGCLPIRISVFHGCHPPPLFRFVARILLFVLGERLRKRVIPHSGTNEYVNSILQNKFNISQQYIPTEMYGHLSLNVMEWLRQRRAAGL